LDFEGAKSLGNAPNALAAAVVRLNIDLNWSPPNVDTESITTYKVWRAACPAKGSCALSPSLKPAPIGFWIPGSPLCDTNYNFCDTSTKKNVVYIYFVTATFGSSQHSGASNQVEQSR